MTVTFQAFTQPSQKTVNQFYKHHQQNVSCHRADTIYTAHHDDDIVAALFIRTLSAHNSEGFHLMRSLFVSPSWRGKGIGKSLVEIACQGAETTLHTLCEADLVPYYQEFNFTEECLSDTPNMVKKMQKKGLVLMTRPLPTTT